MKFTNIISCSFWALSLGGFFALQLGNMGLPFYWDTAAFLIPNAMRFAQGGAVVDYLINNFSDYPHTPLLPYLYSLLMLIQPTPVFLIHLTSWIFSAGLLVVLYRLVNHWLSGAYSKMVVLLFLSNPLFQAQTNLSYFEIVATALRLLVLNCLLSGRYLLGFVLAIIAFFVRFESGVVLAFVLLMHAAIYKVKSTAYMSLGLTTCVLSWLIIHKYYSGWWFYAPDRLFAENKIGALLESLNYLFLGQGRWVLSASCVIVIGILILHRQFARTLKIQHLCVIQKNQLLLLVAVSLPTLLIITKLGYFLPRYIFPLLPIYYFAYLYLVSQLSSILSSAKKPIVLILLALGVLSQIANSYSCSAGNYEDCYTLMSMLQAKKQASSLLERQYDSYTIITGFPEDIELSNPALGFVKMPLYSFNPSNQSLENNLVAYQTPTSSVEIHRFIKLHQLEPQHEFEIAGIKNSHLRIYAED